MKQIWNISDFTGGLSLGSKTGIRGSYQTGTGIDTRLDPDGFCIARKFTKDSSTTVVDKVSYFDAVEVGSSDVVFGIGGSGNIYSKTGTGAWTKLRTLAAGVGTGCCVFNNYLYYAANTSLGRYGALTGTPSFDDSFQTLTGVVNRARYTGSHMMLPFLNMVCVCNNRYLATYDSAGVYNASKLTMPPDTSLQCLAVWGDRLAIGCIDRLERGILYLWDGVSSTYNSLFEVPSGGVRCMAVNQGVLYLWAGVELTLYAFSGGAPVAVTSMPKMRNGTYAQISPGGSTIFEGVPLFNIPWATNSTTMTRGTYSYGNINDNYPEVLGVDYINSDNGSSIELGGLIAVGPTLYSAWKSGTTYGIDKLEGTTVAASCTYESNVFDAGAPYAGIMVEEIIINCSPLASGHTITVKRKANRESSWVDVGSGSTAGTTCLRLPVYNSSGAGHVRCHEFQIQVVISTSGTTSPTIYDISTVYTVNEVL